MKAYNNMQQLQKKQAGSRYMHEQQLSWKQAGSRFMHEQQLPEAS